MKRLVRFRIHPASAAVWLSAFLLADSHLVLAAMAALALHEAAHVLAMLLCGMRECTIELTPLGGMADVRAFDSCPCWKRILSAGAGVAGSALAAAACISYLPRTLFVQSFFMANISLALLNALPAWPLDGARVIAAFASCFSAERMIRRVLTWFTMALGCFFVMLGLCGVWNGIFNPGLLLMGPYLWYAARAENIFRTVRTLESNSSSWGRRWLMKAETWIAGEDCAEAAAASLLGKAEAQRYQLLLLIDPRNGFVTKCLTEQEMRKRLTGND